MGGISFRVQFIHSVHVVFRDAQFRGSACTCFRREHLTVFLYLGSCTLTIYISSSMSMDTCETSNCSIITNVPARTMFILNREGSIHYLT